MAGSSDIQENPLVFLLETQIQTQQMQVKIQGSDELVLSDYSNGAAAAMNYGDDLLKNVANMMNTPTIQSSTVTQYQANYSTLQTQLSNTNNQFSSVMQGQGTMISNSTQDQQFTLSICNAVIDANNNTTQYIGQWAS